MLQKFNFAVFLKLETVVLTILLLKLWWSTQNEKVIYHNAVFTFYS